MINKYIIFLLITIVFLFGGVKFYQNVYKNYYLTIGGAIDYSDGLGKQAVDFTNLVSDDIEMNHVAVVNDSDFIPEKFKKILNIQNKKIGHVFLFEGWFPHHYADDGFMGNGLFDQKRDKYVNLINAIQRENQIYIAYSMFESDRIPSFWVYELNRHWDMVVVPDINLVNAYINSGVKIPIFVVPLGTNLQDHLNAPLKTMANKTFTFANLTSFESRKNILTLVQAYDRAFKNNKDVRLLLAPKRIYGEYDKSVLAYIISNNVHGVTVDIGVKDPSYYNFLFSQIDCYVSPSRGEGFSIIPREAMARGIPVIVSDALAQKTVADTGLVKVVHANKLIPAYYNDHIGLIGNFKDIEVDDLAKAMLDVYNNYQSYLDKAPAARKWAESGQYKHLKEEYINMVKPKKVILSDRNEITKDYLMTNSEELYNKFLKIRNKE